MSIHVTRAPTVPLTSYDTKRSSHLKSRFASANTVPGTQKYHSFVPSAELTLMLRKYSSSLECDVFPKKTVRQRRKRSTHTL